jgi:hypothetical protein
VVTNPSACLFKAWLSLEYALDEVVATGPRLGGERFGGQLVYQYG